MFCFFFFSSLVPLCLKLPHICPDRFVAAGRHGDQQVVLFLRAEAEETAVMRKASVNVENMIDIRPFYLSLHVSLVSFEYVYGPSSRVLQPFQTC